MQVLYEDKREGFQECLGWSRNGSERPQMIPKVSGMVSEMFGMVLGIYGRFGRIRRLWKVLEGSRTFQTILVSPKGSIIGAATFP